MNKFAVGFSILSTLLIGAGCVSDEASVVDVPQTGEAVFAITSGPFTVSGNISIALAATPAVPVDGGSFGGLAETDTMSFGLDPATYVPTLPIWTLADDGTDIGSQGDSTDDVSFDGFIVGASAPSLTATFDITSGTATPVSMAFTVGTVPVVFTTPQGRVDFTLDVTANACGDCPTAGTVCATIDSDGPFCAKTCAAPGNNTEDCDAVGLSGRCLDSASSTTNICEPELL